MPEISVIVPVYKVEPYLRRCIDSILAQTFTDFELILVDDGSPDNCGAICDSYGRTDSRIKVVHKANGGVSSARNTGLDLASGEYVMFCDSDDTVSPRWCEDLYNCVLAYPDGIVTCNVQRQRPGDEIPAVEEGSGELSECSYFQLYKMGISAYTCNKIYSRKRIESIRLRFDQSVSFSEDVQFNVEYIRHCGRVLYLDKELYFYTQLTESAANRYYPDLFSRHLLPFRCRLPLIGEKDLTAYCDIWYYRFVTMLDNVFDKRNKQASFLNKMWYNQQLISSEEFQFCLNHASLEYENRWLIKMLKKPNYFAFWTLHNLAILKNKIRGALI